MVKRKLTRYVHVAGRVYEPGDVVPDDVAELIRNPKAWEQADDGDDQEPPTAPERLPVGDQEPPTDPEQPPGGEQEPEEVPEQPPGGDQEPEQVPEQPPSGDQEPEQVPEQPPGGEEEPAERPARSANKDAWRAWLIEDGVPEGELGGLTKDALLALADQRVRPE
jgi:hypothetical protein